MRFYPSEQDDVEERAYRAGQLHVTYGLPTSKIQTYQRSRAGELQRVPLLPPYVPLFHEDRIHLVHPSVRGWQGNPLNLVDWRALHLEARR